ncbi:MAG: S8 family serine peptidase [Anaerolineae bacterium]|nr:S8 family serine peptidase [Anaerolineae bacterium]
MLAKILRLPFALVLLITLTLTVAGCGAAPAATPSAAPTTAATAVAAAPSESTATAEATTSSGGVSIRPAIITPTPTLPVISTALPSSSINGTPISKMPEIKVPKSIDELRVAYPDLGPFIDKYKDTQIGNIPTAELYAQIAAIYDKEGAQGVATFLEGSGILEKLNLPLSYLDLLRAFDQGGADAVLNLAQQRSIINGNDEIASYLTLDDRANFEAESARLKALDVTVLGYIEETDEIEIGIALTTLAQFQTPGTMLEYLIKIGDSPHIVGWRPPYPMMASTGLTPQKVRSVGAQTIGADKWHEAGITGKGVKIGIFDGGFGAIAELAGDQLPDSMESNIPLDEMNDQSSLHGTALALVAHGIAPDAELYLAWFDYSSNDSYFDALDWLESSKVNIVLYASTTSVGPRDGSFGDAVIVDDFVRKTGALWVNAAGNYAQAHTMLKFNEGDNGYHSFGEDTDVMPFEAQSTITAVTMNWNGNWKGKEKSQYNFSVLDEDGNVLVEGNEARRGKKNDLPYQFAYFESEPGTVYYLAIQRKRGNTDNVLDIFMTNSVLADWAQVPEYSVTTPADADSALSVGATGLTRDELEEYSSQGPTTDDRIKPDISAPTGEEVAGYENGFYGTSGAAPMVAGAAALVLQAFPDMTQGELKAYLMENVVDLGDKGEDPQFGTGRLALPEPNQKETGGGDKSVAVIENVRARFGVKVKRETGLQIKVSFELENFTGKQMVVAALFFDKDGNDVASSDPDYDASGTIGVGISVKPKRNQTAFKNVTLFIPDSAFEEVTEEELYFVVIAADATDSDNWVIVAQSEPIQIVLDR